MELMWAISSSAARYDCWNAIRKRGGRDSEAVSEDQCAREQDPDTQLKSARFGKACSVEVDADGTWISSRKMRQPTQNLPCAMCDGC